MKFLRQRYREIFVILAAFLILAAGLGAIINPKIHTHNIGAGGQSWIGGYTVTGSLGQHDAGGTLSGGGYKLSGGFWGAGTVQELYVHIPLVLR